ncbi:Riboflavin transporter MCH5 [Hypsizygus marmoreus]|uniref:Riboflavin transporter MCH5 n=1 Tax=Hypsizygus marmoreus TaxID=39966 RepID=A0A369JCV3_HYPMA|nr:Riboflavin transporter MCH5 [Hypsizygus marmoreus]
MDWHTRPHGTSSGPHTRNECRGTFIDRHGTDRILLSSVVCASNLNPTSCADCNRIIDCVDNHPTLNRRIGVWAAEIWDPSDQKRHILRARFEMMTLPVVPVPETEKSSSATLTKVDVDKVESDEAGRPQADDFPDGGWRAWSVVLGVWVYQCCTFGYTNTFGVFNDFYVREYLHENYTSSQISWIGSVQLCLVLSSGLVAGRGFDQGYFYHLTIGGACLFVFCLFMISLTKPEQYYQIFLAQGLGLGIAIGVCYVPGLALISQYFYRRRAIAMSIAATGSAAGGALHPIMLNRLFHGSLGFHSSVRASAGMCLGLFALALPLLKPRLPPSRRHSSLLSTFRIFVRDVPYVIMTFGTTITYAGLYFPIFFVQLNAIKNGIEPKLAFYTIAILNTASILGRILPALVVPRVGVFNVVIPCLGAASILIYCTLVVNTAAGTIIFAILYGFFSGTYAGLLGPMIGSLAKSDSEIGARMGICLAFTGIGALVGTPISGALLSTSFIWWRPITESWTSSTKRTHITIRETLELIAVTADRLPDNKMNLLKLVPCVLHARTTLAGSAS